MLKQQQTKITTLFRSLLTVITLITMLSTSAAFAEQPPAPSLNAGLVNPGYEEKPDWFKDSFLDIREDIAEATEENKRLVLYFYQDGCPYCGKLLKDNFGNADIAAATQQNFDVIALNMWGDREVTNLQGEETTEKEFAAELKVQYTPTLLFMDETGKVVIRLNGYYAPNAFKVVLDFVAGQHEKNGSIRDYVQTLQAAAKQETAKLNPLVAGLSKPLQLADTLKTNGRPLLVLFEQAVCAACDELHNDVMKRKEVAYSLSHLDVAQVDINAADKLQTPQGSEQTMADWAKALKIKYTPSLVFFDAAGAEVFRTEAYLKSFHLHGAMDYVVSGAHQQQPSFQRFLQHRMDKMEARGFHIDLMQ